MTHIELLKKVGERIREIRLKKNVSQVELAAACNMEKASLSRIESGKTNITLSTLLKISNALTEPIATFFDQAQFKVTTTSEVELANTPSPIIQMDRSGGNNAEHHS